MLCRLHATLSAGYPVGRIKYREHFRSACDIIASTRRWRRFGRMDGWIDVMARGSAPTSMTMLEPQK